MNLVQKNNHEFTNIFISFREFVVENFKARGLLQTSSSRLRSNGQNYINPSKVFLNSGSEGLGASAEIMFPCGSININRGIPIIA